MLVSDRYAKSLRQIVGSLGERVPASDEDLNKIEQFVCPLYNDLRCNSVNELRYKLFCKSKNQQSHQLPPTKAALKNHLRRVNYQAFLWKHALETQMNQAPDGHGRQLKDGQLEIYWTNKTLAPGSLMELVSCGCKGLCQTRSCFCVRNGLPCTEACTCRDNCHNCLRKVIVMTILMMIPMMIKMTVNLGFVDANSICYLD